MADVADQLGVSAMTVSRVVNDRPGVSDATRRRVRRALEELGYRENMAARTLAGGRSRVLGAVSVKSEFHGPSQTLFGIEAAARRSGHMVNFVGVGEPDVDTMTSAVASLESAHVEGIIVNAPVRSVLDSLSRVRFHVPTVITCDSYGELGTVAIDQQAGARAATAHLLDLGHETVHHLRGARGWVDAEARETGWRTELADRGRPVPRVLRGDWSARSGYDAGRRLATDPDVTAIFSANDQMAAGVLLALHEAGRRVPEDVSVVGFDDVPEAAFQMPPLTTIRQDFDELGRRSVDLLVDLVNGGEPRRELIPSELLVRSSTASPGASSAQRRGT